MFRTETKINVMLSKALRGKAPEGYNWGGFYKTFREETITPRQFAAHIYNGYSFTPPFKNGRRKEENFTTAYHVAFDFDGEGADLDFLMRDRTTANYFSSFAYSTPSSTPEKPKSRVVFIIPDGVETAVDMRLLYSALAHRFAEDGSITDPACKDPLRLYYGSYHCKVVGNWSALFKTAIDTLIEQYKASQPKQEPQKEYTISGGTIALADADNDSVDRRMQYELGKVASAPDGEKHYILNKTSYLFGGWVASGYITEGDAVEMLENAIRRNTGVKNLDMAIKTISTAVSKGMERPATIQSRMKMDVQL